MPTWKLLKLDWFITCELGNVFPQVGSEFLLIEPLFGPNRSRIPWNGHSDSPCPTIVDAR
jgi:hypothetical protein